MEGLCFDIMEMIGKEYNNIKATNKNKQVYSDIVKHLNYYFEEHGMYEESHGRFTNPEFIKQGDIRTDTQFLEYEDLSTNQHYNIIADKYGGQEAYDEWWDNCF
tara:strand:+ start:43 stop:354 length:312 start_codon:yes stop_codon:yes gene_type:complete